MNITVSPIAFKQINAFSKCRKPKAQISSNVSFGMAKITDSKDYPIYNGQFSHNDLKKIAKFQKEQNGEEGCELDAFSKNGIDFSDMPTPIIVLYLTGAPYQICNYDRNLNADYIMAYLKAVNEIPQDDKRKEVLEQITQNLDKTGSTLQECLASSVVPCDHEALNALLDSVSNTKDNKFMYDFLMSGRDDINLPSELHFSRDSMSSAFGDSKEADELLESINAQIFNLTTKADDISYQEAYSLLCRYIEHKDILDDINVGVFDMYEEEIVPNFPENDDK